MPDPPDPDNAERAVLVALLKRAIASDPVPLSPRVRLLRGILAKLEPAPAGAVPSAQARSFSGPKARERAIRYADRQYGLFEEMSFDR
jgi:hypothetical protein